MPKATAFPVRISSRATGLLLAGILQAGFVFALIEGLDIKAGDILHGPIEVIIPRKTDDHPPPPPALPNRAPDPVVAVNPTVVIDTPRGDNAPTVIDPRAVQNPAGPADHGPLSVAATHTTPPYPALMARLGAEGTVVLRLLIGADGRVKTAQMVKSSGYPGLDEAAIGWVIAHWRYQPATKGGEAVDSAANVAVTFNLKNAG